MDRWQTALGGIPFVLVGRLVEDIVKPFRRSGMHTRGGSVFQNVADRFHCTFGDFNPGLGRVANDADSFADDASGGIPEKRQDGDDKRSKNDFESLDEPVGNEEQIDA